MAYHALEAESAATVTAGGLPPYTETYTNGGSAPIPQDHNPREEPSSYPQNGRKDRHNDEPRPAYEEVNSGGSREHRSSRYEDEHRGAHSSKATRSQASRPHSR
jgi:hypothetical protein